MEISFGTNSNAAPKSMNLKSENKWRANIFQGNFPNNDTKDDGFKGVAEVKSYPANAFGLYDMEGNV